MSKSTIPSTMRAHIFTSTAPTLEANLRLVRDAPLPQNAHSLGADQALVRVMATSLNPADYKLASLPLIGRFLVPRPSTPGLDFAGRIAATSPTSALREGALVFGRLSNPQKYGTLAEYIVAGRQEVVPLPSNVSVEDAACIGTAGLVAYQSIASYVGRGSNVFIHGGSGGTGSFGIQVAKVLGCHVTTTCSTANVERCKELGADEVIDYRTTDVVRALKTGSRVMQHVVDNVGTEPRLWDEMTRWTDSNAAYVQVGADVSLSAVTDIMKKFLLPTWLGAPNRKFLMPNIKASSDDMSQLAQWVSEGKVKVVKDCVLPFEEANEGFAKLRAGSTKGKVVIRGAKN